MAKSSEEFRVKLRNQLKDFLDESFNTTHDDLISTTDHLSTLEIPELYFVRWFSRISSNIIEKIEKRVQFICNREKQRTQQFHKLMTFVKQLDPASQNFIESQCSSPPKPVTAQDSPKPSKKFTDVRNPLTPLKEERNNRVAVSPFSSKSLEDKREDLVKTGFMGTEYLNENFKNILGSPLHCSTQVMLNKTCNGPEDIHMDENMKIVNCITPTKKKKSFLKTPQKLTCVTPPRALQRLQLNDSSGSAEFFMETPPSNAHNTIESKVLSIQKKISPYIDTTNENEEDPPLTPVLKRYSNLPEIEASLSPTKNVIPEEDENPIPVNSSVIGARVLSGNLVEDNVADIDSRFYHENPLPESTVPWSFISNHSAVERLDFKATTKHKDWISTGSVDTKSKPCTKHANNNNGAGFRCPSFKDKKRYRQMTLLQMQKEPPENKVDVSTLDEFQGGSRLRGLQSRSKPVKRKSDEITQVKAVNDMSTIKIVEAENEFGGADVTTFNPLPITKIKSPSPIPQVCKKGKKQLDTTIDFIKAMDKLPARESQENEPNFAYKPVKAIRKREERAKLAAWACDDCREYFEREDLSPGERQKLINQCSKHRSKHPINLNGTPAGYWDTDFPPTLEPKQPFYTNSCSDSDSR